MPAAIRLGMTKKDEFERIDLETLEVVTGGLFGGAGLFGGGGLFGRWRQQQAASPGQNAGSSCASGGCPGGS
jgi:hypothetical protein